MIIWTIFLGIFLLAPWILLLTLLSLKYIFNKPVQKQWKLFFITLGLCYLVVLLIGILVFILGSNGVFN